MTDLDLITDDAAEWYDYECRNFDGLITIFDTIIDDLIQKCGTSAKPYAKELVRLMYEAQYLADKEVAREQEQKLRYQIKKMEEIIRELRANEDNRGISEEARRRINSALTEASNAREETRKLTQSLEKVQKELANKQATIEMYNNAANQNNSVVAMMTKKNLDLETEIARLTAENANLAKDLAILQPKARKLSL
jgi:chromosome segregation ATPase